MTADEAKAALNDPTVLVVDLDGTLTKTDTLHEALLALASQDPLALIRVPGWALAGPAVLKARLADRGVVPPGDLPLNDDVVDLIRRARAEGRRTILVSAADQRQVAAVAEATGLFDEAHGSSETDNLKGERKAAFLADRYGKDGFDYVGDSAADVPVWRVARAAYTVGAGQALRSRAEAANQETRHLAPPTERAGAMVRALRPHQWSKNLLLFIPTIAAHQIASLPQALLGFVAFCLAASAIYVLNDLVDLESDRAHPRKCRRPFAAGDLRPATGLLMAGGLLFVALGLSLVFLNAIFLAVMVTYLLTTFAYSLWLKQRLLIDVITLAGLYTIRIIAGGAAATVNLSPWMLGFSVFLFLSLAAVKRQAELTDQLKTGRENAGRAYIPDDLPVLRGIALSAGQAAVLVLALYISSDDVRRLYNLPALIWLICPLLLYWNLRMVMKTHRGEMDDDPIVFATRDKVSLVIVGFCVLLAIGAAVWPWGHLPI